MCSVPPNHSGHCVSNELPEKIKIYMCCHNFVLRELSPPDVMYTRKEHLEACKTNSDMKQD